MGHGVGCCGALQRAGCGAAVWLQGTAEGCLGVGGGIAGGCCGALQGVLWGSAGGCYGAVQSTGGCFEAEEIPHARQLLQTASLSPVPGAAPSQQVGVCHPIPGGSGEITGAAHSREGGGDSQPSRAGVLPVPGCVPSLRSPVQSHRNRITREVGLRAARLPLPRLSPPCRFPPPGSHTRRAAVGWADVPGS